MQPIAVLLDPISRHPDQLVCWDLRYLLLRHVLLLQHPNREPFILHRIYEHEHILDRFDLINECRDRSGVCD